MSPGIVWVVVAQDPWPKVARLMNSTQASGVSADMAGMLPSMQNALTSITILRARSSVHPCFIRREETQPPPTLPISSAMNGMIKSTPMRVKGTSR